jgi:NAD-dependent dihydropyrimidine dehydrogenase PreA subunit
VDSDVTLALEIEAVLNDFKPTLWGACDTNEGIGLPDSLRRYPKALAVVIPFASTITLENYTESFMKGLQWETYARMRKISLALAELFDAEKIRYDFPPSLESSDTDAFEREMTEAYSAKEIARRAGIGWIGRNNLLITRGYGPRLSILVMFCDGPLQGKHRAADGQCGACRRCVENCAYGSLRGKLWEPGVTREEQIDYASCSRRRLEWYDRIGRKAVCGKCIAACPWN